MTFELAIKDRTYQIEIGELSQCPIKVTVNGREYFVEVIRRDSPESVSAVAAEPAVSASPKATAPGARGQGPKKQPALPDGTKITAPMPGKILSVKVGEGDHVEVGQALCTLEAMKMEMAISSTASGTVVRISVEPGQTVNHGDTLCVIA